MIWGVGGRSGALVYRNVLELYPRAHTARVLLDTHPCASCQALLECLDLHGAVDSVCKLSPGHLTDGESAILVILPATCGQVSGRGRFTSWMLSRLLLLAQGLST